MLAAARRWLWLANRRRLHRRERARALPYADWYARHDSLGPVEMAALQQRLARLPGAPAVTIVLEGAPTSQAAAATRASLQEQMYTHWRLVEPGQADLVADAEWLTWTTAGDCWRPHALLLLVEAALHSAAVQLVYADHDTLQPDGTRSDPVFKPDWNPPLLWSHDYIGTPALWRAAHLRTAFAEENLADSATRGSHARVLRATAGLTPSQVLHVPHVLVHRAADAAAPDANAQAVAAACARANVTVTTQATPYGVHVQVALPDPAPHVSIVVPTRNGLDLLRRCITTTLQITDYPSFDMVIVDNGSDDPACLRYLQTVTQDPRVTVRRDDGPFNYAALNNAAVAACSGSVVVLLNNDIEVVQPGWLREMVSLALLPQTGAVGAKLLYGDGTVQHVGVVLGIGGEAGHVMKRLAAAAPGYLGCAQRLMAVSAVTGACLAVRRDLYLAVGGLDAERFAVAFNDIDFCLRLQARGLRNLFTPHALLLHHESATRGSDAAPAKQQRLRAEQAALQARWGPLLQRDPAYNPNLSLQSDHIDLADPPRVTLTRPWFADAPEATP